METLSIYAPKLVTSKEYIAPGHRACSGCGEVLAVRYVCKALGRNTIISNATGCMEIISSPLPQTSWEVPWIHTLFENASAVASGIESGLKALKNKHGYTKEVKVVAMGGDGGTADIGFQALSGAPGGRSSATTLSAGLPKRECCSCATSRRTSASSSVSP